MSSQENINIVRRFFEEVYNKLNINALDQLTASSLIVHDAALPNQKVDLRGYKEAESMYNKAFPDRKTKIEDIFSVDDKVCIRWSVQGHHKGNLKDISATNRDFKVSGLSLFVVKNGKISEMYNQWDRLGLLEQIGEIQPAEALH